MQEIEKNKQKRNINKKEVIRGIVYFLVFSAIVSIYFGIAYSFIDINDKFIVSIVNFVGIMLSLFIELVLFDLYFIRKSNVNEECKYRIIFFSASLFFFSFLYGLFSFANHNSIKPLSIVVGVILICFLIYAISSSIVNENKEKNYKLVINFILVIGITCYLIYILPKDIQDVVIPIIAAIYGGMITLTGVAWTIKNTEKNRKEDFDRVEKEKIELDKKKAKPFFVCDTLNSKNITNDIYSQIVPTEKDKGDIPFETKFINSDNSNFYLEKIYCNGNWHYFWGNNLIIKNSSFRFDFTNKPVNEWDEPFAILEVSDILGNLYYFFLWLQYVNIKGEKPYNSVYKCSEYPKNEIPSYIWEENRKAKIPEVNNNVEEKQC